ncbi:MAG: DMT family transporter [Geminicoccaceae bacterium]
MEPVAAAGRLRSAELRGIVLALAAMLMFGLMDAASKYLSARYPTPQIIWLRYVFTIPMALAVLAPRGLGRSLRSARPWLQVLRSVLLVIEIGLVVWCFGRLPLADVHAVLALTPLAVTALSVPLLGEKVGLRRWAAVGVGLLGVLIILRPGLGVMQPAALVALASVLLWAVVLGYLGLGVLAVCWTLLGACAIFVDVV